MMHRPRKTDLCAAIVTAAEAGKGLYLSPAECRLLARHPAIATASVETLEVEWRQIPGYERYEVSERGEVRRGLKLLKQREMDSAHRVVSVYASDGQQWRAGVHSLVALAFHGPAPEGKPLACHENGRPWENYPDNIYWGSHADNADDKARHRQNGRGRSMENQWKIDSLRHPTLASLLKVSETNDLRK